MGIPGFLPKVLKTAGRPLDLEAIAAAGGIFMTPSEARRHQQKGARDQQEKDAENDEDLNHSESQNLETQEHQRILPSHSENAPLTASAPAYVTDSEFENSTPRRPLRIGVDVSCWIHRAAFGFGDMLGDERHLTNYGRASLVEEAQNKTAANKSNEDAVKEYVRTCVDYVMRKLGTLQEQSKAKILVVLDGASPPVKRTTARDRRASRDKYSADRDDPVDPTLCQPFLATAFSVPRASTSKERQPGNSSEADTSKGTGNATSELDAIKAANEKRVKAFRRAGAGKHYPAILASLMGSLTQSRVTFLVSPYEADSQLAYLSQSRLIDLVLTEDSDLVAHGAASILYKWDGGNAQSKNSTLPPELSYPSHRILHPAVDLGSVPGSMDLTDFSPVMVAVLFVTVGCDYCEKLEGIGLITASRIVRSAFLEPWTLKYDSSVVGAGDATGNGEKSQRRNVEWSEDRAYMKATVPALALLIQELFRQSRSEKMDASKKEDYENTFLSALFAYRHPIVYDPVQRKCVIVQRGKEAVICGASGNNDELNVDGSVIIHGDPELIDYPPYAELCDDPAGRSVIIGEMPRHETAAKMAGGMGLLADETSTAGTSGQSRQS